MARVREVLAGDDLQLVWQPTGASLYLPLDHRQRLHVELTDSEVQELFVALLPAFAPALFEGQGEPAEEQQALEESPGFDHAADRAAAKQLLARTLWLIERNDDWFERPTRLFFGVLGPGVTSSWVGFTWETGKKNFEVLASTQIDHGKLDEGAQQLLRDIGFRNSPGNMMRFSFPDLRIVSYPGHQARLRLEEALRVSARATNRVYRKLHEEEGDWDPNEKWDVVCLDETPV